MKFGKLSDISQVQFDLPPLDDFANQVLQGEGVKKKCKAYVGCPMWGNKDWAGKIYPKSAKPNEYLSFYAQAFNTIELNTTHYRIPTVETVLKWKNAASPGFEFCPKIPQSISHRSRLSNCHEQVTLFCKAISQFEEKLGCSFLQLPESFGPLHISILQDFLSRFPREIPLAIEFRHPDWFTDNRLIDKAADTLFALGVGAVITDVAGRRDVLHTRLTNKTAMLRFVGNGLHPTDYSRLEDWLVYFKTWIEEGLEKLYLFVHEPDDAQAPEMGSFISRRLNESFKLSLPQPKFHSGVQGQLF